jgi:hypothetical protein
MAKTTHGLRMKRIRDEKGRTRYVPCGVDKEAALLEGGSKYKWSKSLEERVVDLTLEGKSITQIAAIIGYPASAIYDRRRHDPPFRKKMDDARADRSYYFEGKAIEAAEQAGESHEEISKARLQVDTYKWAAEVNNPEQFGKKTKIVGDASNPVVFVIDTGIRRDEKVVETIQEKIPDKKGEE